MTILTREQIDAADRCLGEIIHGILAPDVSEALSVAAFQKPEPSRG